MSTNFRSIEFSSLESAAKYRKQNGGWLFVAGVANAWWFDARCYTPLTILKSRQVKGMQGNLVCDNRYEDGIP